MNVHDKKPIRRLGIDETTYEKCRPYLREDFNKSCGYCDKFEMHTYKGFEIDHLVPINIDESKKTSYNNLVYSCFTCNRKKGKKWPTNDTNILNDGKVGLIDPVSLEYDNHLFRDECGNIRGKTELGRYICEQIFLFDIRPTGIIWKLKQLEQKYLFFKEQGQDHIAKYLDDFLILISVRDECKVTLFEKKE